MSRINMALGVGAAAAFGAATGVGARFAIGAVPDNNKNSTQRLLIASGSVALVAGGALGGAALNSLKTRGGSGFPVAIAGALMLAGVGLIVGAMSADTSGAKLAVKPQPKPESKPDVDTLPPAGSEELPGGSGGLPVPLPGLEPGPYDGEAMPPDLPPVVSTMPPSEYGDDEIYWDPPVEYGDDGIQWDSPIGMDPGIIADPGFLLKDPPPWIGAPLFRVPQFASTPMVKMQKTETA